MLPVSHVSLPIDAMRKEEKVKKQSGHPVE